MSKSKYTNLVCVIIICLTILVTVLFILGGSLGVVAVSSGNVPENTAFSQKDLDSSWSETDATYISLGDTVEIDGGGAAYEAGIVYIASSGTYIISGEQADTQIMVSAQDCDVQLVFAGVDIGETDEPAIYVEDANHVYLTLEEGCENRISLAGELSDEAIAEDLDSVIYSKCSLTINGAGSLSVSAESVADSDSTTQKVHGIKSTDDLIITGGTIRVNASGNALAGKDSVRICGGTFDLTAGNDGIKSNNDSDEDKGYILITDGEFTIVSSGDGIQAQTDLTVEGGCFDITAGGGSDNASAVQSDSFEMSPDNRNVPSDMDMGKGGGAPDMSGEDGSNPPDMSGEDGNNSSDINSEDAFSDNVRGEMPGGGRGKQGMQKGDQAAGDMPKGDQTVDNLLDADGKMPEGEIDEDEEASWDTESETESCKGLKAGTSMTISGGTFHVDCADDALHSDGTLTISDGTLMIGSGDDGIHAEEALLVEGGEVTVTTSYEGIESNQITITDGEIDITSSDDGMNASGGSRLTGFGMDGSMQGELNASDISSDADTSDITGTLDNTKIPGTVDTNTESGSIPVLRITGGTIHVNAGGDGLDSNGNLIVEGGLIYVDGPTNSGNGSLDYGSENGGDCVIYGGTILALGASGMEEVFSDNSDQTWIHYDFTSDFGEGDELTITDAQGKVLFEYVVNKSGNCVIFSGLELVEGETYTLTVGDQTAEVVAGESTSSGENPDFRR